MKQVTMLDEKKRIAFESRLVELKNQRSQNVLWERFTHDFDTAVSFLRQVQLKQADVDTMEEQAQKLVRCLLGRTYLNSHLPARYTAIEQLRMLYELKPFIIKLGASVA